MNSNIEDRIAVQDVMLRYAASVDDKDYDGYRALFVEDVEVVGMGAEAMNGMATFYPWWKDAIDKYDATQHMLSPTLATISGDTAKTRTDVQATHYPKGDSVTTITLWATYKTDMRRVEGEWKISRHELVSRGLQKLP
ncbi:MAG: nuclear transport factor 2 family protein [Candidatus Azotimanducaceae bacterium WSBS_2022_MAG_OTU7]